VIKVININHLLLKLVFDIIYFFRLPFCYVSIRSYIFPLDLNICISTNINYSQKSLPKLLASLKRAKVPSSQIYVFEGGHTANNQEISTGGINYFKVNHNSFDITSLIGILENNLQSNGWLLLHDTVIVFPCFIRLINQVLWRDFDTVQFKKISSMNMGIYKGDYLSRLSDNILKFKNIDYSDGAIQLHKQIAINFEDFLFQKSTNNYILNTNSKNYFIHDNIKYCGSLRRRETFMNIGLVKYKANFSTKQEYSVTV
jgi:hypothetical protein